ncbi:hypothetical protein [Mycobacterium sp. E740]|uniref:hypothetical protein n=1 Tax=Mycobacterium sp. E740 TaxID=1834149 RepID=UPI0008013A9C|nr:hypothetical protein [Mycobacterium sp. E740]OBI74116.1 hypothetical protein A5663_06045 [Mycobacterium sp. E740]
MSTNRDLAVVALSSAAIAFAWQLIGPAVGHAQDSICPRGSYLNVETGVCVPFHVNPPNPVVGPAGPAGVGGVVGPVGPGPVGPRG